MNGTSVLTIVRGRSEQLRNLAAGVAAQTVPPLELVVVGMGEAVPGDLPCGAVPLRRFRVDGDPMPLAAARNLAAREARGDRLVFLDADCIAAPQTTAVYARNLDAMGGCLMGEVRYLPLVPRRPFDIEALARLGQRHPAKPDPPPEPCVEPDYGQLWGLSFALGRADWDLAGGMDEAYVGYGGEETDFARRLERVGIPLYRIPGALALHQYHEVAVPPLGQFDHIVRNARLYHHRWGHWCMDYWLDQFAERGFVAWSPTSPDLTVLRFPSDAEITAARARRGTLFT